MAGHILAKVQLVDGPEARHFAGSPAGSYPTILQVGSDSFSSQVMLGEGCEVKPGAVFEVSFRFLVPEAALQRMVVGTEFLIWEQKRVGKGCVLEVLAKA